MKNDNGSKTYEFSYLDHRNGLVHGFTQDNAFISHVGSYWRATQDFIDREINDPSRLEELADPITGKTPSYEVDMIDPKTGEHTTKTFTPELNLDKILKAYDEGVLDLDEVIEGS